jgi:peptide/nickel transport system permease protein
LFFCLPFSTAPSWFYGLFLIAIFAGHIGLAALWRHEALTPTRHPFSITWACLERMRLPFTAVFLSVFFYSVYVWRTFFLIYANEDYVDMAQAKGLSDELVAAPLHFAAHLAYHSDRAGCYSD